MDKTESNSFLSNKMLHMLKYLIIVNDILKWEECKHEIKEFSQQYAIQKSRKRNNTLQQLEKQLKKLYANNNPSLREIADIETQIANIYDF